jgi:glucose-1-phosphate cytidylyltransferase
MKVVIIAGGLGTRLVEKTEIKPKPMVEIGGRPILSHIMKLYAHRGHTGVRHEGWSCGGSQVAPS